MTRKMCDRCGVLLPLEHPLSNAKFPIIEIVELVSIGEELTIDLCYDCTVKFIEWLTEGVHMDE